MTPGHDVSEYLGTLGLVQSYFFSFFEEKNETNREKKYLGVPTPPEDEVICMFAGLLDNPDMVLSLHLSYTLRFVSLTDLDRLCQFGFR